MTSLCGPEEEGLCPHGETAAEPAVWRPEFRRLATGLPECIAAVFVAGLICFGAGLSGLSGFIGWLLTLPR